MDLVLQNIPCGYSGFTAVAKLAKDLEALESETIRIDISRATFVAANMCAPLAAVLYEASCRNNVIRVDASEQVSGVLRRNGFLWEYTLGVTVSSDPARVKSQGPRGGGTVIAYTWFQPAHDAVFAQYVEKQVTGRGIPEMTPQLRKKFRQSIHEIFDNAVVHSGTDRIFACGQLFLKRHRLDFTIADIGIGIRESILRKHNQDQAPEDAISWAMSEAHTTKTGSVPGGIGLKLLREFIELNGGKIHIASDYGYWELGRSGPRAKPMEYRFPGTVVNIEMNTADTKLYSLASEADPGGRL